MRIFGPVIQGLGQALDLYQARHRVLAENVANAESTRTPAGGPYRRHDVVLEAAPQSESFDDLLAPAWAETAAVRVARVVEDQRPAQLVFDPGHPDADPNGYVAMPN